MIQNKKRIPIFIFFLSTFALLCSVYSTASYALEENIVAVVNNTIISNYDLKNAINLLKLSPSPGQTKHSLRKDALKLLVDNTLKQQAVIKNNAEIDDETLQKKLTAIAQDNHTTLKGLEQKIASKHIGWTFFKKNVKTQIEWQSFIVERYLPQVTVTDTQINTIYNAQNQGQVLTQKHVVDIFLPFSNKKEKEKAKHLITRIQNKIKEGTPFQTLARLYSKNPNKNGDLGWITSQDLNQQLGNALTSLKKGEVSPLITTDSGFHILKVIDVQQKAVPQTVYSFIQASYPFPSTINQEEGKKMVQYMMRARQEITSCQRGERIKRKFRNIQFNFVRDIPQGKLPKPLLGILKHLKKNQTTPPIQAPNSFLMFTLCSKRTVKPQLVTKDMIKAKLTQNQLETFAEQYLETLQSSAYIKYK